MGIIANMEASSASLITQITQALQALPEVEVGASEAQVLDGSFRLDAVLRLEVKGKPAPLLVECKAGGYPRDVREALWQLEKYQQGSYAPSPIMMFVAPMLSAGARALLQEKGISYADNGGSLYLRLPWALYFVERNAPPAAPRKAKALYQGSRAQV